MIRAEILELTGNRGELRWDRIKEALDADATLEQNVANLKEFGQAEPLSNPSMLVNWPQEAEIVIGERVPVVESVVADGRGDPQPKIRYEDVGVRMSIEGRWLTTDERARAELVIDAERTAMGSSSVTVAYVTLPTFTQRRTKKNLTVEESKPVWLACSEWPTATSADKESLVLMRITVSRAG